MERYRNFAAWTENYIYSDTLKEGPWLGWAYKGQSHKYHIFLETRVTPWRIQWYVDDIKKYERVATTSQGIAAAASERETQYDNNWAHWWELKRQNGTNNWGAWTNLMEWTYRIKPLDPTYYINERSNTEFYVQQ